MIPAPTVKLRVLRAGVALFHGTDAAADFAVPRGPAWFAFDEATAARWAGWTSTPGGGERRVLKAVLRADVALLDTESLADWEHACLVLCDDPDAPIGDVADAVARHGYAGWFGKAEAMLSDTSILAPAGRSAVPAELESFGGRR